MESSGHDDATIDAILDDFRDALGPDFTGYRNHCQRVAAFCRALTPGAMLEADKVSIAAAFHDLGIWTAKTWDYLEPSVDLARTYLSSAGRHEWVDEIVESIACHHKITPVSSRPALVEGLRRADLADVSLGVFRSKLTSREVRAIRREFPNAGFHLRLAKLGCAGAFRTPLKPMPMMRW